MHDIETIIFGAKSKNMTVTEYLMENYSPEEQGELQLQLMHRMLTNRLSNGVSYESFIDTVVEPESALV